MFHIPFLIAFHILRLGWIILRGIFSVLKIFLFILKLFIALIKFPVTILTKIGKAMRKGEKVAGTIKDKISESASESKKFAGIGDGGGLGDKLKRGHSNMADKNGNIGQRAIYWTENNLRLKHEKAKLDRQAAILDGKARVWATKEEWKSKSRWNQAITILLVILLFGVIGYLIYLYMQEDEVGPGDSGMWGGSELLSGGSIESPPFWADDKHDYKNDVEYTGDTIFNCGRIVKDILMNKKEDPPQHLVEFDRVLYKSGDSIILVEDDIRDAAYFVYNHGKLNGKFRSGLQKVVKMIGNEQRDRTPRLPMKVYPVKRKKKRDENGELLIPTQYEESEIYISMDEINEWRNEHGGVRSDEYPSGRILIEEDSVSEKYKNNLEDEGLLITPDDITNFESNGDFKIYLGLVYTDGMGYGELLDMDDEEYGVYNICENKDRESCDEEGDCLFDSSSGECINMNNPAINGGGGLNHILRLGQTQYQDCPREASEKNIVFGLNRFINNEVSQQSLIKYDEVLSSNILQSETKGLLDIVPESNPVSPYNHLCENPTVSGLADREIYCGLTKMGENCVHHDTGEKKQCYDSYPKVVVTNYTSGHRRPIIQVVGIDQERGRITHLTILEDGINQGVQENQVIDFYIKRKPSDIDTDPNLIRITDFTIDSSRSSVQKDEDIMGVISRLGNTDNSGYKFFSEMRQLGDDESECSECYIHNPVPDQDCSGLDEMSCRKDRNCHYDGTSCVDVDCSGVDAPLTMDECIGLAPACRWKSNDLRERGECVDDLRLDMIGDGVVSTELVLDLDGYDGDTTSIKLYDCFDQNGELLSIVEDSDDCSDGVNPVQTVYRSRINEAFKLIHNGCRSGDYCENDIRSCVSSDELESEVEYRCPVDTTNCAGSVVEIDQSRGAPDYSCSDGGCLVREDSESSSQFEIMGPNQRRCENRSTDDCERFDNDIVSGNQACLLDGDSCNINPASNDPHDCIMSNYNEPSADGKYYVGDEDQDEIIKSLNCERFKYGNTSRGTFMCQTCDGHIDENGDIENKIDGIITSSESYNPCPEGWECNTDLRDGNRYCVDTYMPNRNAYVINDEICFPPFYGTHGSSLRNPGSTIDEPERGDTLETQCAAGPESNHMYKKNGSPMLPHLFPELFGEVGDEALKTAYSEYMGLLDENPYDSEMYFNKEEKNGPLYELLERYFNMDAIDYCKNIFTPDTVLINPTMPGQDDESSSFYYPGWIQLKNNILNTVKENGESGALDIFSYLNLGLDPELQIQTDGRTVTNWDNQICMMHRGVDNDLRCTLPINASSITEEICNQITDYHWDTTDQTCRALDSSALTEESLENYLSTINQARCEEMGGTYITAESVEEQFQRKKNNRLIPVHNERYCSICRNDEFNTCTTVQCGLNTDASACNPDGSCNCYGENMGYGPNCEVEPTRAEIENVVTNDNIGNKIVHPDNSYSYGGRTTSSSELPIGYNMICKGDYLDPDRTDNTQRNTNYVGKYCGSTMNEVCHSRKPIFSSENYSEELQFLNILDMDTFIEKLIDSHSSSPSSSFSRLDQETKNKYQYWPFYHEDTVEYVINHYNKIMLIVNSSEIEMSSIIKNFSQLVSHHGGSVEDIVANECQIISCIDHPYHHARMMHTIALYLFDPYLTKLHYTKTDQPDVSNMAIRVEVAPEWEYNIQGGTFENKIKTTHENFENLPIENKIKYYALAIKMASQFTRNDETFRAGRYSHLQILLYQLSKTLQLKNGDHKMNFYNAYFKEWSSTSTGTGNDTMVNCDCTRPSREDNSNIYTFINNYNPGDINKISRWAIKPPGMSPIDNEHLYYYGDKCENYDAKGLNWTTPDPIQGNTSQDENLRCNINTSLSSWNETHDQPRQINDIYSYQGADGIHAIEDGSIMGDDKSLRNNPFKNPKDYYDGGELSFLRNEDSNSHCINSETGEVTSLCGDKESIKNEYDHQKSSMGNTWNDLYSAPEYQSSESLASHLPDFENMPEINLIERLRISKSGAKCDCSYSQSNTNDGDVKNSSKWGEFCQYTAGDVCNQEHMYDEPPPMAGGFFKFNEVRGNHPDDYLEGKREKQINKKGDYPGIIYSHNYFDGRENTSESAPDFHSTEEQAYTGLDRINFSIDGESVEIGNRPSDWYQKKINSKIPVIKNPKFKEINQTGINCSEGGGATCDESLYSLCKCDDRNIESRFTSGVSMSSSSEDNKISCNVVADNCDYSVCQHKSSNISTTGFGGFEGGVDTVNPGGSWQCSSNPFGFDVGISQTAGSDLTDSSDTKNVCFCDENHYQVGDTPNCHGSCCPPGESSCGWKRDAASGKKCVRDDDFEHGPSQLINGTTEAYGRKEKMNAHAVYNSHLNKNGTTSHFDYDPLCEDKCYHTDKHNSIHRYLNEVDSDWASGDDRDHAAANDNLTLGPGGGLNANVKFDRYPDYSWGVWSTIGPELESGTRTLSDDFYDWLPSHPGVSIIDGTDSLSDTTHANYKCVPKDVLLGPWKERSRTRNAWMDYYDSSFDDAIEEVFETNKGKYLLGDYRNNTYKDGDLYYDVTEWDDTKPAKDQIYGENHDIKAYDGTSFIDEGGNNEAPTSGRNPMWLLAKGCCSDVLKVSRRSQGGVNEVKVSCA